MNVKEKIEYKFLISKAGALKLTRRSETLRRAGVDPTGLDWYWINDNDEKNLLLQYDPNVTKDSKLEEGQRYAGETVKHGSGTYRADGSIMFSKESEGYSRIWNNSQLTGNEEMGVITNDGVLVLPSWDNTPTWSKIEEYDYSFSNGKIIDAITGEKISFSGTVHTHINVNYPSREDYGYFGDHTPNIPFYVFNPNLSISAVIPRDANTATPLILQSRGKNIGGVIFAGYSLKNRGK